MTRTSTSQVQLNHAVAGSGETLVLVHGGWSDRNNWLAVVPTLAESFRVVAYDRRGHGLSPRGVAGSRRDQEDELAALIEGFGGEPVNVAGTSFGASIAIGLASRRPELVRRLVAHEPPLMGLVAGDPDIGPELAAVGASIAAVLARVERGDAPGAARQFVEEVAFQPGAWEMLPAWMRETMIDTAPALVLEQQDPGWAIAEPAAIECQVLLSQGDQSPAWFRQIVAKVAASIDDAELHTYLGAGHAPHITHPADYAAVVTDFMSKEQP